MKTLFISLLSVVCLNFISPGSFAQSSKPFWDEIMAFKKEDSLHPPLPHAILFVGSSSFRKWTDISQYFPGYNIINRGFGGSVFPDIILYANEIIFPYNTRQIVIYCGDNDLASSDTITASVVAKRFEQLFKIIRQKKPLVDILFVSIKPSPSRRKLMPKIEDANRMIRHFLINNKHAAYADVYHLMLNKIGEPLPEIFLNDSLHMNSKGYDIWKKVLKPYLIKK